MSKFFGCPECGGLAVYEHEAETKEHGTIAKITCQNCGGKSASVIFPKGESKSYAGDFLIWEWYERCKNKNDF